MSQQSLTKLRFYLWALGVMLLSGTAVAQTMVSSSEEHHGTANPPDWLTGVLVAAIAALGSLLIWAYKQEVKKTLVAQKIINETISSLTSTVQDLSNSVQSLVVELRRFGLNVPDIPVVKHKKEVHNESLDE